MSSLEIHEAEQAAITAAYEARAVLIAGMKTRADLMQLPEFADLCTDSEGNPCVWRNFHLCAHEHRANYWETDWSCQCDDECDECGCATSPYASEWVGPKDADLKLLWEDLPEEGAEETAPADQPAPPVAMDSPFTVLLLMPVEWHSDQPCAADCVTREWVAALDVEGAVVAAVTAAMDRAEAEGSTTESEDWAVLAVYRGHQFDIYQS